jgi:hypothetical protein
MDGKKMISNFCHAPSITINVTWQEEFVNTQRRLSGDSVTVASSPPHNSVDSTITNSASNAAMGYF